MGCPGKFKCMLVEFDYFPWCKESRKALKTVLKVSVRSKMEVSLLPHLKDGNMRSSPCAAEEERCERPDKSFWSICDRDTFE